jgi:putative membrane protein
VKRAVYLLGAVLGAAVPLASAQGMPTDPQIAAIVVTANQVDIDAGKLAEHKAKSVVVEGLEQGSDTNMAALGKLSGPAFDKA